MFAGSIYFMLQFTFGTPGCEAPLSSITCEVEDAVGLLSSK